MFETLSNNFRIKLPRYVESLRVRLPFQMILFSFQFFQKIAKLDVQKKKKKKKKKRIRRMSLLSLNKGRAQGAWLTGNVTSCREFHSQHMPSL